MLSLLQLFLVLLNRHVHELSFFTLFILECLIISAPRHAFHENFNLLLKLMLFLSHLIDSLDQVDVVLHEA